MCLTPAEMKLHVCKMEVDSGIVKPPKRKKPRRLKKRKHCTTLFGVDLTNENDRPSKQRKMRTAAPENTTQFIMADKQVTEPFYVIPSPSASPSSHCTSSPGSVRGTPISERDFAFDSGEDELVRDFEDFDLDFFQRDFEETYNRIQEESLLALPKSELVCRYRELEGREESLHKRYQEMWTEATSTVREVTEKESTSRPKTCNLTLTRQNEGLPSHADAKVENVDESCLRLQLEDLRRKNKSLAEENLRLKALKCSSVGLARLA